MARDLFLAYTGESSHAPLCVCPEMPAEIIVMFEIFPISPCMDGDDVRLCRWPDRDSSPVAQVTVRTWHTAGCCPEDMGKVRNQFPRVRITVGEIRPFQEISFVELDRRSRVSTVQRSCHPLKNLSQVSSEILERESGFSNDTMKGCNSKSAKPLRRLHVRYLTRRPLLATVKGRPKHGTLLLRGRVFNLESWRAESSKEGNIVVQIGKML